MYFETTIKFYAENYKGELKAKKEIYLVNAFSFGDAEQQALTIAAGLRLENPYVVRITPSNITGVVNYDENVSGISAYKVRAGFEEDGRKFALTYLCIAENTKAVEERMSKYFSVEQHYKLYKVVETNITQIVE